MKTIVVFLAACMAVSAQTQKVRSPDLGVRSGDLKVALQRFGESDLHVIRAQKGFSTIIEFPVNQGILEATCGDKEFWVIEGNGRFLNLKPAKEGITTNLNVLVAGDIIYSFLLKEVSKSKGAKEEADFRVTVSSVNELAKLRKDKEDLEEAIAQRERALKDLISKYEGATKMEIAPEREPVGAINKTNKLGTSVVPQALPPLLQTGTPTQATSPAQTLGVWRRFGSNDPQAAGAPATGPIKP
jgi:type IV secretory pathway VirB9-like protein